MALGEGLQNSFKKNLKEGLAWGFRNQEPTYFFSILIVPFTQKRKLNSPLNEGVDRLECEQPFHYDVHFLFNLSGSNCCIAMVTIYEVVSVLTGNKTPVFAQFYNYRGSYTFTIFRRGPREGGVCVSSLIVYIYCRPVECWDPWIQDSFF